MEQGIRLVAGLVVRQHGSAVGEDFTLQARPLDGLRRTACDRDFTRTCDTRSGAMPTISPWANS